MSKFLTLLVILHSGLCFSQTRDTILTETDLISKDRAFEMSISMISPGVSVYTSALKNHMTNNTYFNMVHLGFASRHISASFLVNLKGINLSDSFSYQNQSWIKGMELVHYSLGINLGYKFRLTSRFSLNPFAGISSSHYYLVKNSENDPAQNSNTSWGGQYGLNAEYRFKPRHINSFVYENGDLEWNTSYWSILLQTGAFPSLFKGNAGLNGTLFYFAVGGSFNIGTYTDYKK